MTHSRNKGARILGIDPGTNCGWSYRDADGNHTSGVWNLSKKRHESMGARLVRFRAILEDFLAAYPCDVICYEQAVNNKNGASAMFMGSLIGVILACASEADVECMKKHWATVKKFATGKGNASKVAMCEAAERRWGYSQETGVWNDNEADARWLAECAANELNGAANAAER